MSAAAVKAGMEKKKKAEAKAQHEHDVDSRITAAGGGKVQPEDEELPPAEGIWKFQPMVARTMKFLPIEVGVAGLIGANFITNVVQMQHWPTGSCSAAELDAEYVGQDCVDTQAGCSYWGDCPNMRLYFGFEFFYNVSFTIELLGNMYGFWFWKFWSDSWNVFDFIVVTVGVFGIAKVDLGALSMLRMLRAFRVFRLFKRVPSLKKILESLAKAVPGVMNAFLILFLIMCIYAILATELFRNVGLNGKFVFFPLPDAAETERAVVKDYSTARSGDFGREYFGTFGRSLFTMFQVLTGESWAEAIARPLMDGTQSPFMVSIYFVTFNLLCGVVLLNVVVAVLLEKMVDDPESEQSEEEPQPANEQLDVLKNLVSNMASTREGLKKDEDAVMNILKELLKQKEEGGNGESGATSTPLVVSSVTTDSQESES